MYDIQHNLATKLREWLSCCFTCSPPQSDDWVQCESLPCVCWTFVYVFIISTLTHLWIEGLSHAHALTMRTFGIWHADACILFYEVEVLCWCPQFATSFAIRESFMCTLHPCSQEHMLKLLWSTGLFSRWHRLLICCLLRHWTFSLHLSGEICSLNYNSWVIWAPTIRYKNHHSGRCGESPWLANHTNSTTLPTHVWFGHEHDHDSYVPATIDAWVDLLERSGSPCICQVSGSV